MQATESIPTPCMEGWDEWSRVQPCQNSRLYADLIQLGHLALKKPFCVKTDYLKYSKIHMMSPISLKCHVSHGNQGFDYYSQFGSHTSSHPAGKGSHPALPRVPPPPHVGNQKPRDLIRALKVTHSPLL